MPKLYFVLLAVAVIASPAQAGLVSFTWSSQVDAVLPADPIPGVSASDELTVTVIADNGGSSLASQQWFAGDIVAVHLTAGSYSAVYTEDFIQPGAQSVFETDGMGLLSSVRFAGTGETTVVDNFGTDIGRLYNTQVRDTEGRYAYFVDRFVGPDPTEMIGWDRSPDVVPEPSAWAILCSAMVLGVAKRRR